MEGRLIPTLSNSPILGWVLGRPSDLEHSYSVSHMTLHQEGR
jgi:hypothetical protein